MEEKSEDSIFPLEIVNEYRKEIDRERDILLNLEKSDEWDRLREVEGVTLWKLKVKGSDFVMFKTTFTLEDSTAKEYHEYFYRDLNNEDKKRITIRSPASKKYSVLKIYGEGEDKIRLIHTEADTGRFVKDRDFLFFRKNFEPEGEEDEIHVVCFPTKNEHHDFHKPKGHLRGWTKMFHRFRNTENGVFVSYIVHADPKGWIISSVYNALAQGSTLDCTVNPLKLFKKERESKKE